METIIKSLFVILIVAVLVFAGGFYLTNQMRASSERFGVYLQNSNEPVISDDEIVWYNKSSHEIKLTEEGVKKIQALKVEDVTYGDPFVLKIGDQEIYNGSFWTPISSIPYHGIAIVNLVNTPDNTIKLDMGYPSGSLQDADPRNDTRIFDHFQKLGKLKQTLKIEIDYNPPVDTNALFQFQNDTWYIRGSAMHIVDNPNQQSTQLRKGDSVVLKLAEYPSTVRQGFLSYNSLFLQSSDELGDIGCEEIGLDDPPRFVVPDGYYVFELGVANVDCYWFRESIGAWIFDVTVIPA